MQNSLFSLPKKSYGWIILLIWMIAIFFIFKFLFSNAFRYLIPNAEIYNRFWDVKWFLLGHVAGGILAILVGPLQFWDNFRNNNLKIHRKLGMMYLLSIVIASISATFLAWNTAIKISWSWAISLQGLAVAWMFTISMAFLHIKNKNINDHRKWMMRSYVVTFGFVVFRFIMDLPYIQALGSFPEIAPTVGWIAWVLPLGVLELFFQSAKLRKIN